MNNCKKCGGSGARPSIVSNHINENYQAPQIHANPCPCLTDRLESYEQALKAIAEGYVTEGNRRDCPGCDYDGYINLKHHSQCVYVIAKEALGDK